MSKIAVCTDVHICERNMRCRKDNYLEAALSKLDYIANNSDKVIVAGDLFHICSNSTYLFNKCYNFFSKHKNKFIIVPGNHDTFHGNYTMLDRTTLGSLYYTDAIDLRMSGFEIDGVEFEVSLVMKDTESIPVDTDNNKILIGHNYYEMDLAPKESLTKEDIKKLNYYMVILGHDHKPYEEEFVGNSILIRMGSLTRIDVQDYNENRELCYYEIDSKTKDYTRKVVPCKNTNEVYIDGAFKKIGKKHNTMSFTDIADVLEKFKKQSEGNISLHKVLKRLKTPEKSIDYVKQVHRLCNVDYS